MSFGPYRRIRSGSLFFFMPNWKRHKRSQQEPCSVIKHTNYVQKQRLQSVQMSDGFLFFVIAPLTLNSGAGVCVCMRVCVCVFADGCLLVWESVRHVLLLVYLVCGENVFIFWLFKAVFKMRNKCNTELQRLFSREWAVGGIGFLNLEDGGNAQHNNVFIIFNHLKFMILIYIDTDRRLIFLLYSLYFVLKWHRYIVLN